MLKKIITISILSITAGIMISAIFNVYATTDIKWWYIFIPTLMVLSILVYNYSESKPNTSAKKRKHFLTSDEVFEIWYQLAEKNITQKEACNIYDISQSTVNNIANKKHKHQQAIYKIEPKIENDLDLEDIPEPLKVIIKSRKTKVHLSKGEVHEVENSILKEVEKDLIMSVMDISKNTFSAIKNGKHSKSSQNYINKIQEKQWN